MQKNGAFIQGATGNLSEADVLTRSQREQSIKAYWQNDGLQAGPW